MPALQDRSPSDHDEVRMAVGGPKADDPSASVIWLPRSATASARRHRAAKNVTGGPERTVTVTQIHVNRTRAIRRSSDDVGDAVAVEVAAPNA